MIPSNWFVGISTAGALSAAFYAGTLANRIDANERAINDLRVIIHELAATVSAASLTAAAVAATTDSTFKSINERLRVLEAPRRPSAND